MAMARTNTASPRIPYTMDGTAARLEMLSWMIRRSRLLGAYSSSQIAVPTPSGKERAAVRPRIQRDPTTAGQTPARAAIREGNEVMKDQDTPPIPSEIRSKRSTTSMSTPKSVAPMATAANTLPVRCLCRIRGSYSAASVSVESSRARGTLTRTPPESVGGSAG